MSFWNLYLLHKVYPLWLRKVIANIIGFLIIYPFVLYNSETALMLSIFLSVFIYRKLQNKDYINDSVKNSSDLVIYQLLASLFCACIFIFNTWKIYVIQVFIACIFLRIYDFYKPSLIGRFYKIKDNIELWHTLSSILHGVLSGISVMIVHTIFNKFAIYCPINLNI